MKIIKQEAWDKGYALNSDPYGRCVYDFAKAWAEEMEKQIEAGRTVAECAKETCWEVDRRPAFGITGFMYGAAVATLSQVWEHGEELRRWHNLDTQIGNEGERANESGKVLNPAMLVVGDKSS